MDRAVYPTSHHVEDPLAGGRRNRDKVSTSAARAARSGPTEWPGINAGGFTPTFGTLWRVRR